MYDDLNKIINEFFMYSAQYLTHIIYQNHTRSVTIIILVIVF